MWKLRHGIASCITVTNPDGVEWQAIYRKSGARWNRLGNHLEVLNPPIPDWIVDLVRVRFEEVFALPIEKRGDYCTHNNTEVTPPK